ncbi:MAG: hypothetical protein NC223_07310 [Butyrivibrio sp.]|nr:hypothetical protein [Butyrivibrio sp.]
MKKKLLIVTILSMFFLTGCAKAIEMTDEQSDMVAEYAAGALIRRSYSYKLKYPNINTEKPSEEPTVPEVPAIDPTDETKPEETAPVGAGSRLGELLGILPVEVSYTGYKVLKEYPDDADAIFTFEAEEGYEFIVLEFSLHNPGSEEVTVNTAKNGLVFKADINEKRSNNYANLMLNDISNLNDVVIGAGEDFKGILVFMVDDKSAADIQSFSLMLRIDDKNTEILKVK